MDFVAGKSDRNISLSTITEASLFSSWDLPQLELPGPIFDFLEAP